MTSTAFDYREQLASERRRHQIASALLWAQVWYWMFNIIAKAILVIVYWVLISRGLVLIHPELGYKLSKLIPFLDYFEATYQLNIAHLSSITILFLSFFFWHLIIKFLVSDDLAVSIREKGWENDWPRRIVFVCGAVVSLVDAGVFYGAFNAAVWGQTDFSFGALVATVGYVVILVAVTFISVFLGQSVTHFKKKEQELCEE